MQALAGHARIGIDSNVLIYLLETQGRLADAAASIVDAIGAGTVEAVLATVGVMEILAGPARAGDAVIFEHIADVLRDLPIRIVGLDRALAEDAAWIRGSLGIGLEDAIHLATARKAAATAFVTNDRRIRSIPRVDVVYLDDLVA
ncbi:MAG: hypothetical protein A2Z32_14470 [Chloroflexi bacterium RBG_16_69_14]|nr:MAG: hypothetical protein A2Z32_14470 [Chloroflexi bacterium RBG_16_69_14]